MMPDQKTLTHPALAGWVPLSRIAGEGVERSEAGEGSLEGSAVVMKEDNLNV